jgi:hypothetical protein
MKKHWTIKWVDGQYEIHQGNRRKRAWPEYTSAVRWLRHKVKVGNGEKVYLIEEDGYRTDITRRHFLR